MKLSPLIAKLLIVILSGISMLRLNAQQISFDHLTVQQGLSSNAVLSITQDKRGFMWFGTAIGLNRYDGTRFKVYKNLPGDSSSLSNNNVNALICDSNGAVWVGTSVGLNRYNPRTDDFTVFRFDQTASNTIYSIFTDSDKRLWVGTGNGLFLFNNSTRQFTRFLTADLSQKAGAGIRSLFEDSHGNFWIGTNDGLLRMTGSVERPQYELYKHRAGDNQSLNADFIMSVTEDEDGHIWVGTQGGGLNIYDLQTNRFSIPQNLQTNKNVRKILRDASGRLWVGTQEGLNIVGTNSSALYRRDAGDKSSLSQNSIYSIYQDRNRTVWIGSYFGGINAVYPIRTAFSIWQNNQTENSISNNVVSSMVEDSAGNLWIGTEGGGLNYYNSAGKEFTAYTAEAGDTNTIGSNLVKVVYLDKDGNVWAGTHGGGLNVLDKRSGKFSRYLFTGLNDETLNSEIVSMLEDREGRFWIGTNYGIRIFSRNGRNLQADTTLHLPAELAAGFAKVFHQDKAGNIFIGTNAGLFQFRNNSISRLANEVINCIYEDPAGTIRVGMAYGGILQIDPQRSRVKTITARDGLPANNIIGILGDGTGNLWLSTDNGLIKYDPDKKTSRVYSVNDGIADNAFNYNSFLRTGDNRLFFGGYNGITVFNPAAIESNRYASPVVFTGLSISNEIIHAGSETLKEDIGFAKELKFYPGQDVITIEFALLNFIRSSRNHYAYQLEGFDKKWIETNLPVVTYTNLPPGRYRLLVKGANSDGVWSETASIDIKVLPPFWRTWWAYSIYFLLAIALVFMLTRFFFLRALLRKEEELHQVKLNFFTNISHEIRTHLTLIMIPLERLLDKGELKSAAQQQLTQAKQNADRLLKLVSELMDFRKAETEQADLHLVNNDLNEFLQAIIENFRPAAMAKSISLDTVFAAGLPPLAFDREQMEKVFSNLLSNAVKFTTAGGKIDIDTRLQQHEILISVSDNGKGIAKDNLEKIFNNFFQVAEHGTQNTGYGIGLALTKKLVEQHDGKITVESVQSSEAGKSFTRFVVSLPLRKIAGSEVEPLPVAVSVEEEKVYESIDLYEEMQGVTILLVEDNAELRLLMHDTFSAGYRVVQAEDGEQGWQLAVTELPDLIISDVMMPGMDGFELCAKLKTDERTSHIPVILLTAKSTQNDQLEGLHHGADVYLTKPFNTRMLELNVRNLLALKEKMRLQFSRQIATENVAFMDSNMPEDEFVQKIIALVDENMDNPDFGVDMLAKKVAMSQPVLYRKLKAVTNMSVNDFVKTVRLKKASQLLRSKKFTVYEVAYAVGFADRKYFSREFKKQFGVTPSEYAEG